MLIKNKNFLLLLFGRILTNIADSIYYIASMWLVYDLGGSAFYSGIAGFLTSLPWAFQFLTGPLVDRWKVKKILVVSQIAQAIILLIIPVLYHFDALTIQLVLVLMPLLSIIQQFVYPAQSKVLPFVVKKEQLVKANASFSIAYQGIDFIFNAISGVLVAIVGAIMLFTVNSIFFTVAAMLFALLKLPKTEHPTSESFTKVSLSSYWTELKEGFQIIFQSLMALFILGAIAMNFAIGGAMALLPAFADNRGGPELYGYYLAAMSVGGLAGALLAPKLANVKLGSFYIISYIIAPIAWVACVSISSNIWSILLFTIVWIPVGASNVIVPSMIQSAVPTGLLGRVNSVSVSMSNMIMPLGSLISGYLALQMETNTVMIILGALLFFEAVLWFSHPKLRNMPVVSQIDNNVLQFPSSEK